MKAHGKVFTTGDWIPLLVDESGRAELHADLLLQLERIHCQVDSQRQEIVFLTNRLSAMEKQLDREFEANAVRTSKMIESIATINAKVTHTKNTVSGFPAMLRQKNEKMANAFDLLSTYIREHPPLKPFEERLKRMEITLDEGWDITELVRSVDAMIRSVDQMSGKLPQRPKNDFLEREIYLQSMEQLHKKMDAILLKLLNLQIVKVDDPKQDSRPHFVRLDGFGNYPFKVNEQEQVTAGPSDHGQEGQR
jgi:uncharacterized coiled-coil protein SlyX